MIDDKTLQTIPTPSYVIDYDALKQNLEILKSVSTKSGAKILLAQKAFSAFYFYPLISKYLSGSTASSYNEARLGYEEMGSEVHIFSPAYKESEFDSIVDVCSHVVFNSFNQFEKFKSKCVAKGVSMGIRVNHGYSEIESAIYNPCAPLSRLGVIKSQFEKHSWQGIDGLHFHTMCEQGADVLERTIQHFEKEFGEHLKGLKWLNIGGGHHITKSDYDIKKLVDILIYLKDKYGVEIYIEPGEAVALNAGYLVTEVVDIVCNQSKILIVDTSAACHMPDVIEMPYRPPLYKSAKPNVLPYTYNIAGPTCLAGDVIGEYSFEREIKIGDKLVFEDMAIYSMVKNNTFNGIDLPQIASYSKKEGLKTIKTFGYADFKNRLS